MNFQIHHQNHEVVLCKLHAFLAESLFAACWNQGNVAIFPTLIWCQHHGTSYALAWRSALSAARVQGLRLLDLPLLLLSSGCQTRPHHERLGANGPLAHGVFPTASASRLDGMLHIGLVASAQQLLQRAQVLRRMVRASRACVCGGRPGGLPAGAQRAQDWQRLDADDSGQG